MEEIQKQQQTQVAPPAQQRKAETPMARFNRCITSIDTQNYLLQVLGRKKEQFVNNITALVANDVNLQGCAPMSLVYASLKATALDFPLDNNLGFAYVIPYNHKRKITDANGVTREVVVKEAQLQWGYRAFIQLAIRSNMFKAINVADIRQGEIKAKDLLTGDMVFEVAPNRLELPVIGYVAFFALTNGFSKMLYMTVEELENHAMTYSQTYSSKSEYIRNSSRWATDFDAMSRKTVLKRLLKNWAPLSVQMQEAVRTDQLVFDEHGKQEYLDAPDESETKMLVVEAKKEEMKMNGVQAPDMP